MNITKNISSKICQLKNHLRTYFELMAKSPPAITGDLKGSVGCFLSSGRRGSLGSIKCHIFVIFIPISNHFQ